MRDIANVHMFLISLVKSCKMFSKTPIVPHVAYYLFERCEGLRVLAGSRSVCVKRGSVLFACLMWIDSVLLPPANFTFYARSLGNWECADV